MSKVKATPTTEAFHLLRLFLALVKEIENTSQAGLERLVEFGEDTSPEVMIHEYNFVWEHERELFANFIKFLKKEAEVTKS